MWAHVVSRSDTALCGQERDLASPKPVHEDTLEQSPTPQNAPAQAEAMAGGLLQGFGSPLNIPQVKAASPHICP